MSAGGNVDVCRHDIDSVALKYFILKIKGAFTARSIRESKPHDVKNREQCYTEIQSNP